MISKGGPLTYSVVIFFWMAQTGIVHGICIRLSAARNLHCILYIDPAPRLSFVAVRGISLLPTLLASTIKPLLYLPLFPPSVRDRQSLQRLPLLARRDSNDTLA